MDLIFIYMWVGFLLATYSVNGNDAVQTLGTFIASNSHINWKWLWLFASSICVLTLTYSWFIYNGDVSYERLNRIPFQTIQWYHLLAPILLFILTRAGVPASTSLVILTSFASSTVIEKILIKSMFGYAIAALTGFVIWLVIARWLDRKSKEKDEKLLKHDKFWRVAQWCSTGTLWHFWLTHDAGNPLVFLPRSLSVTQLVIVNICFVLFLLIIFRSRGGKIQEIIKEKHNTRYIRSATIVDAVYAFILYVLKEWNDLPLSTTWVFLGLLCGREFGVATMIKDYKFKAVFPLVKRDFLKLIIGLASSILVAMAIQGLQKGDFKWLSQ